MRDNQPTIHKIKEVVEAMKGGACCLEEPALAMHTCTNCGYIKELLTILYGNTGLTKEQMLKWMYDWIFDDLVENIKYQDLFYDEEKEEPIEDKRNEFVQDIYTLHQIAAKLYNFEDDNEYDLCSPGHINNITAIAKKWGWSCEIEDRRIQKLEGSNGALVLKMIYADYVEDPIHWPIIFKEEE